MLVRRSLRASSGLICRSLTSSASGSPPVLDLYVPREQLVAEVADACAQWGFFQVVNHNVDPRAVGAFEEQTVQFFDLPMEEKRALRRSGSNARGFFDDELTKQKLDWKQVVGSSYKSQAAGTEVSSR